MRKSRSSKLGSIAAAPSGRRADAGAGRAHHHVHRKEIHRSAAPVLGLSKVVKPAVPAVKDKDWAPNPIDAFIAAKLDEKKLKPNPPADRHFDSPRHSWT